ncbi:DUF323 domain-containing protein [Russula earlei]|uniref:DUF323 domain-containing protein n=1 Tax=Russula earlei TaxID=71964 RepID=A0ACC0UBG6_9AGAM|nr:DUF323 domain-containing protein [Russula earlei]
MPAHIIDVRLDSNASNGEINIRDKIVHGLSLPLDQKVLPVLLLYDEEGLRIYDEITEVDDYYLFPAENNLLQKHSDDIVKIMQGQHDNNIDHPTESVVLELGAGAMRKTSHILSACSKMVAPQTCRAPFNYYALDLERRELERTLNELIMSPLGLEMQGKIDARGLWGTYEGGLKFVEEGGLRGREVVAAAAIRARSLSSDGRSTQLSSPTLSDQGSIDTPLSTPETETFATPLHILFLGSSIGNFARGEDAAFLRSLPLRAGKGDTLLLGLDQGSDAARIERAYNDPAGVTRRFILNGLKGAGRALGDEGLFAPEKWEYLGRYNPQERRHEAYLRSRAAQTVRDPQTGVEYAFLEGELVQIETSHKYSESDAYHLFTEANLRPLKRWTDPDTNYTLWLLERPPFNFKLLRSPASGLSNSPFGVPTLQDFHEMWAAWDFVTRTMIPDSMLFEKPIDLRHICLFYTGHIPAFLDIQLSKLLGEPNTEPGHFKYLFERGIDPNVDDPTQCHPHSEVPQKDGDWPSHSSILDFQERVRARLSNLYAELESGHRQLTRRVARVLFMTHEHEAFHTETLLYMLIQRAGTGTIPPSVGGFATPCWESLAEFWDAAPNPSNPIVQLGPATVEIGHDDFEAEDTTLDVKDHEFGWDNEHPQHKVDVGEFRIEWRPVTNGQFYEYWKRAEGKVPMPKSWAMHNGSVMVSNSTKGLAWNGQVRTLYGLVAMEIAHLWPIITDYNSLSDYAIVRGGRLPTEAELRLFYDKFESGYEGGRNVGFRNLHPVPATTGGEDEGRGHNGGVWEWTSTIFEKREGFEPSLLYPAFSADFFDTHHNVVIGGSYATIPRQAERRTLRNYFQRNYPYAWIGGRIVYDVEK